MEHFAAFLHQFPVLCLFLSILVGHIIGRWHFKGVGFGSVVGTLIAGIVIGILAKPELPELLRWAFFYLFLFSVGYSVGPQFFGSLKKRALPQVALAVIVALSGLAAVIGVTAAFRFDEGIAVGLLSGGMTQWPRSAPESARSASCRFRTSRKQHSSVMRRWLTRSPTGSATWV